jgi:ChpA-C
MFKKFVATGVLAVATTGAVLSAAPAYANDGGGLFTSGDGGILSGNQIIAPISVPISICGNAIAILGIAGAGCEGGSFVGGHH